MNPITELNPSRLPDSAAPGRPPLQAEPLESAPEGPVRIPPMPRRRVDIPRSLDELRTLDADSFPLRSGAIAKSSDLEQQDLRLRRAALEAEAQVAQHRGVGLSRSIQASSVDWLRPLGLLLLSTLFTAGAIPLETLLLSETMTLSPLQQMLGATSIALALGLLAHVATYELPVLWHPGRIREFYARIALHWASWASAVAILGLLGYLVIRLLPGDDELLTRFANWPLVSLSLVSLVAPVAAGALAAAAWHSAGWYVALRCRRWWNNHRFARLADELKRTTDRISSLEGHDAELAALRLRQHNPSLNGGTLDAHPHR